MAGFDEGPVYYFNEQEAHPWTDGSHQNTNSVGIQAKFEEFLRTYEDCQGHPKYGDMLIRDKTCAKVDLKDVRDFNAELAELLEEDPGQYLPLLENAAAELLAKFHQVAADGQEQDFSGLQVLLHSSKHFGPTSLRNLSSEHVSKLIMVPCIVTSAGNPKHKATHITLQCKDCRNTKLVVCKPVGGTAIPRACDANVQAGPGNPERCSLDPFQILVSRSKFADTQILKVQERPEDVPTGELPRSIQIIVDRHLVGQTAPGTRITAFGIYSIFQNNKKQDNAGVAVRVPYIRVVAVSEEAEGARSQPIFTVEEEQTFKEFAAQPNIGQQLFSRMAPNIYGHDDIKKALACLLFGGARKDLPDGTSRRGDINVLLIGDPSTAKSQFLKFASKTAPIAIYTSGKGSSAAGLTATVVKNSAGEFYLEGGAMVLADNGVVCIDEFDKMRAEDRVAIHEAMEQQTISVAKAGITTMLKSRTSVLAAANPPSGRYDDLKTAQENIDLQSTILSRFDLIFIVKDVRSVEKDRRIARHVLDVHRNAGLNVEADEEDKKEEQFLKRYLEYARSRCSPRLSEAAADVLCNTYVELREEVRQVASSNDNEMPAVPMTVRQLEAIIRISESLARMQLMTEATEVHVHIAIDLFKASTMDAVRSGVIDAVGHASEEQRAELHAVEDQIKRRVAIGSHVSERKLVDELVRVGMSESLIRRALLYMTQSEELRYVKERRWIHRLK